MSSLYEIIVELSSNGHFICCPIFIEVKLEIETWTVRNYCYLDYSKVRSLSIELVLIRKFQRPIHVVRLDKFQKYSSHNTVTDNLINQKVGNTSLRVFNLPTTFSKNRHNLVGLFIFFLGEIYCVDVNQSNFIDSNADHL